MLPPVVQDQGRHRWPWQVIALSSEDDRFGASLSSRWVRRTLKKPPGRSSNLPGVSRQSPIAQTSLQALSLPSRNVRIFVRVFCMPWSLTLRANLFNPLRLQYVILRTQFQSRCDYDTEIYVPRRESKYECSNGNFTVSGPLHHELCTWTSRASCLERPYLLTSRWKVKFSRFRGCFLRVCRNLRMSDQVQLIAWHGIQRQIIWIFCRESEVSG